MVNGVLLAVQVLVFMAFLWTGGVTWSALWAGWPFVAVATGGSHILVHVGARA